MNANIGFVCVILRHFISSILKLAADYDVFVQEYDKLCDSVLTGDWFKKLLRIRVSPLSLCLSAYYLC